VNREDELWTVPALILGDFTERDFCHGIGDPISADTLDLSVKHELMDSDTRRLALLLKGEPLRIETKAQREAINEKDFRDALKAPVPYEPDWTKDMNKRGEDPNMVLTPALHTGHCFGPTPEDARYTELITQAQAGAVDCQLATIALAMIRPFSDYLPVITSEHKEEFNARLESPDRMSITVYEYEPGHFMVSGGDDNYATYILYRQRGWLDATCIVVGSFTKTWAVDAIDKPFKITLSPQAGYDPEKTAVVIGRRVYELMRAKDMHLAELSRLTGISYTDLRKITDDHHPVAPSIEQLERIARVLAVKASDIVPF
jgi:DNA-binding Xre family transcriptional regulator